MGFIAIKTPDGNAHVLYESTIQDWVSGRQHIEDTVDWQQIVRRICEEWLTGLGRTTPRKRKETHWARLPLSYKLRTWWDWHSARIRHHLN